MKKLLFGAGMELSSAASNADSSDNADLSGSGRRPQGRDE